MSNLYKLAKPTKMLNKITSQFKRDWMCQDISVALHELEDTKLKKRAERVARHLWYPTCGVTIEELAEVVEEQVHALRVEELLNV